MKARQRNASLYWLECPTFPVPIKFKQLYSLLRTAVPSFERTDGCKQGTDGTPPAHTVQLQSESAEDDGGAGSQDYHLWNSIQWPDGPKPQSTILVWNHGHAASADQSRWYPADGRKACGNPCAVNGRASRVPEDRALLGDGN
eukprot:2328075-Rhodomonas_salina.1